MNDNTYEPMDVDRLRTALAKHGPLFSEDGTSGFAIASFDEETAEVVWRNAGTDESTRHRDEIERLSRALNRNGYEARLTKPANTTLAVRKVEPVVIHGSALGERTMGPFEKQVEQTFAGQAGNFLDEMAKLDPKSAFALGEKAFRDGKPRVPVQNPELMDQLEPGPVGTNNEVLKAYLRGWDTANLAEPLPESINEAMTRMPAQHRNKLNNEISGMIGSPLREIPLGDMDMALRRYGYLLVNEDGTPWGGFLTGREGRAKFDIGVLGTQDDNQIHQMVDNAMLVLTWYKFDTGRYEVVAYVS